MPTSVLVGFVLPIALNSYAHHNLSRRPWLPAPRVANTAVEQRVGILASRARTGANVFCVAIFNIRVDRPETRFELSRDRFAPARYGAVTALVLRREGGDARALLPAQNTGWP